MLYSMTQEQLAHTLFPLGTFRKSEVRALAGKCGFVNASKPDSQDICFVPDGDYGAFLEDTPEKSIRPARLSTLTAMFLGCTEERCAIPSGKEEDLASP